MEIFFKTDCPAILTSTEARLWGFNSTVLTELVRDGMLERIGQGLYLNLLAPASAHRNLVLGHVRSHKGVVCLFSALHFHGIIVQEPAKVWLAVKANFPPTQRDITNLHLILLSNKLRAEGVERHVIDGVEVPIFNVAKTVADCFKFRRLIGSEVALKALRSALETHKASPDDIIRFARLYQIEHVIRPYLAAMV